MGRCKFRGNKRGLRRHEHQVRVEQTLAALPKDRAAAVSNRRVGERTLGFEAKSCEEQVILQVLSDSRKVDLRIYSELFEFFVGSDAGQKQKTLRSDNAG